MNAEQLKDMQEVVEDAKANALRFPEISFDDLEALVKLGFECLKLREQQRWIPVSERLPNNSNRVLALTSDKAPVVVYLDVHKGWCTDEFYSECGRCGTLLMGEITHWMPLPEAPAGEQA